MHLKTIAFTTTALTVLSLSSAAMANSNSIYLLQEGLDNTAFLDQSQATNSSVGGLNGGADPARQVGDQNSLEVLQTGGWNQVGTASGGVLQDGFGNEAFITQTEGSNVVGSVSQTSVNGGGTSNSLQVNQTGVGDLGGGTANEIGSISQTSSGAGGLNQVVISQTRFGADIDSTNAIGSVTQDGGQNLIDVYQGGDGNTINSVGQVNDNNFAVIAMDGNGNFINQVYQGHPAAGFGINNSVNVSVFGNNNGRDVDGTSPGVLTGDANVAGADQGTIGQNGGFNTVGLTINGDNNLFGVYQSGQNNRADTLNVNGYDNQLGVVQLFENNVANVDIAGGDGNTVGIRQDTTNFGLAGNTANVTLSGYARENTVSVLQTQPGNFATVYATSEMNDIDVVQSGADSGSFVNVQTGWNTVNVAQSSSNSSADVNVTGSIGHNTVYADQSGGAFNSMYVEINGDYNNYGGMPFMGAAGLAADMYALEGGRLTQSGSNNFMEARIGTNGGLASDNLFASLQMGNDNVAVLNVSDGSSNNQFALVQTGDANVANVTQAGFGNSVGILQ